MNLILAAILCAASGQPARMELHSFASNTPTDQQFLTGSNPGIPTTVVGELRLPSRKPERVPAVVLIHGSGGISENTPAWAAELNSLGIATFIIDGFTPRNIVSTAVDQSQLGRFTMIDDAYRALELLSRHPRIDPARIALMGFSRGGIIALYAAMKRFQRLHGRGPTYAAYLPFYPACHMKLLEDADVQAAPIHIFHGTGDDWVPIGPCRSYVERLREKGADVHLHEYEGARHAFDTPAFATPLKIEKARTPGTCRLEESEGGAMINVATQKPFKPDDECMGRGPTLLYDEKAHAQARKDVEAVLRAAFGLATAAR